MTRLFQELSTVKEAIAKAADFLKAKGIETSRLDAEVLLAFVLNRTRADIFRDYGVVLRKKELSLFEKVLERRGKREPVSYIRGIKEFYSFEFKVDRSVLAPRPDTEILLDTALKHIDECGKKDLSVLDIGTGSGILAVLIARLRHLSSVYASDLSRKALCKAKENAEFHGVADKITFVKSDIFSLINKSFDLIVSNPPYVRSGEIDELNKEIRLYEPRMALDGGEDGLKFVSLLVKDGIKYLEKGGALIMEIGDGQSGSIKGMPGLGQYRRSIFIKDLSLKDRVLFLKR